MSKKGQEKIKFKDLKIVLAHSSESTKVRNPYFIPKDIIKINNREGHSVCIESDKAFISYKDKYSIIVTNDGELFIAIVVNNDYIDASFSLSEVLELVRRVNE